MNRANGSVFQRNGSWAYRVQWREEGSRRSKRGGGFKTKGEAQQALRKVLSEIDSGRVVTHHGTVAEWLSEWLDTYSRSGKVKRSTIAAYSDHVHKQLVPRIGQIPLGKLTPAHVARLYADLLAGGEVRHKSGRGLSPKTVRNIHQTLNKALGDAVRFGKVTRNVCESVDLPRYERPEIQAWTVDELQLFLGDAASRGDSLLPVWYLLASTPLRRGEVCGLKWSDVDLVEGLVTVRSTRLEVHGEIFEDSPKSRRGRRTLAVDTPAVIALAALRNAQEENATVLGGRVPEYVVTDHSGLPISPETLTRKFYAATKRARLPQIRLHSLRHTWASFALQEGVSVHVVAGRLGHSDPGFTLRTYAPFMPSQDREAIESLTGKLTALLGDSFEAMRGATEGAKVREVGGESKPE